MRLGKLQASGYVADTVDTADDDFRDEMSAQTPAGDCAAPRPTVPEREQVTVSG